MKAPYPAALPEWLGSGRAAPVSAAPPPIVDLRHLEEEDPYQCAYCGRPTNPEDNRCRHCRRGLLASRSWRSGGFVIVILILAGLQFQSAVVQAMVYYMHLNYPAALAIVPGESIWGQNALYPALARVAVWAVVILLLVYDAPGGHTVAGLAGGLDLGWAAVGFGMGEVSAVLASVNGLLASVLLLAGAAAYSAQSGSRVRLRVVLDRGLDAAMSYDQRAIGYAQRGQWALAALHWRRAIALQPYQPAYYKGLGRARARLGRRDLALEAFRSGAEVTPQDKEWERLMEAVRRLR